VSVLREIITDWTLPSGGGHASVMYFDATQPVADQRLALNTFWTSVKAFQATGAVYTIRGAGRDLESTDGALAGAWSHGTVYQGAGGAGSVPVPDSSQALIQWHTPLIVGRRFLRGRTFVPALGSGHMAGGNVLGTTVTALTNAGATLAAATAGLRIWHRPVAGSGGADMAVSSVTCWTEFAVLRRRRG